MGSPARTRRGGGSSNKGVLVRAFLAVLLLVLLRCSPCQGRKLPVADQDQEQGSKVMHFQGGLVLRVSRSHDGEAASAAGAPAPRGFSRAARSMRSVLSPGVGH
ncbi:hypothetical protein VPH35_010516 [Triticum aestivum]